MTDQVFYRKWRPQAFSEVVGQEHVTTTLLNALASDRVAHAYLFCGPRGTGKTSMGRILAKAINCLRNGKGEPCNDCTMCADIAQGRALDLIEIDAASNRGIDEIRSLREKVGFAPNVARRKVYIIDEVHMLTAPAFNALLKTLEEPPPHTVIVLATTESHKLPATIISRCQRFDLRRISRADVVRRLAQVCESEGAQATDAALGLVARSAGGSLRDAENILEQLVVGVGGTIDEGAVRAALGIGGREQMRALAHAALERDLGKGLAALEEVAGEGFDLAQFHRELLSYLRGLMLLKAEAASADDLSAEEQEEAGPLLAAAGLDRIVAVLRAFGAADLKDAAALTLPLELALVEIVTGPQVPAAPAAPERAAPQQPRPSRPPPRPAAPAARAPAAAAPNAPDRRPPPARRPPPPPRAPAPQPTPEADPGATPRASPRWSDAGGRWWPPPRERGGSRSTPCCGADRSRCPSRTAWSSSASRIKSSWTCSARSWITPPAARPWKRLSRACWAAGTRYNASCSPRNLGLRAATWSAPPKRPAPAWSMRRRRQALRRKEKTRPMMNKNLMKQAQQLQQRIAKAQQEIGDLIAEGSAGGGVVTAVVSGDQRLLSLKIDPEAVSPDDVDMLEDLVFAAVNEGLEKSRQAATEHLSKATGGLNIPGLT